MSLKESSIVQDLLNSIARPNPERQLNYSSESLLPQNHQFNKAESRKPVTIFVEGNIGAGKSTLLNALKDTFSVYDEPVDAWQNLNGINILESFYQNPKQFATLIQLYISLTLFERQQTSKNDKFRVFERSLLTSRNVFLKAGVINKLIDRVEAEVIERYLDHFEQMSPVNPDLLIYIRTTPQLVYKRILNRGRKAEQDMEFSYIKMIHDLHEKWIENVEFPTLIIDGDKPANEMIADYEKCKQHVSQLRNDYKIQSTSTENLIGN